MAMIGLVRVLLTRLLPRLMLTTSHSMPVPSTRQTARTIVGTVSPSAYFVAVRCRSFYILFFAYGRRTVELVMTLQVQTQHNRDENNTHSTLFVRSGSISLDYGSLKAAGFNTQDWSNSCQVYIMPNGGTAFLLTINDHETLPSHGPHQRYYGFPVRCLVY